MLNYILAQQMTLQKGIPSEMCGLEIGIGCNKQCIGRVIFHLPSIRNYFCLFALMSHNNFQNLATFRFCLQRDVQSVSSNNLP